MSSTTKTDLTRKQRELIRDRYDASRVRIEGDEVHVLTRRERGDGGPTPWWMFAGYLNDVLAEIA